MSHFPPLLRLIAAAAIAFCLVPDLTLRAADEKTPPACVRVFYTGHSFHMFVPPMVEEPKAQGNGAEIRINIKGMTIRIPDGVTADHIERVLLAVQVST